MSHLTLHTNRMREKYSTDKKTVTVNVVRNEENHMYNITILFITFFIIGKSCYLSLSSSAITGPIYLESAHFNHLFVPNFFSVTIYFFNGLVNYMINCGTCYRLSVDV